MRYETTRRIPPGLKQQLRPEYLDGFTYWQERFPHLIRDVHTVYSDEGEPILVLGSTQLNLMDEQCQLWFVLTRHFSLDKLPACRAFVSDYWNSYRGPKVVAITTTPRDGKFARWFGGKLEKTEDGKAYYRMSP